jgi:hypothetical protein
MTGEFAVRRWGPGHGQAAVWVKQSGDASVLGTGFSCTIGLQDLEKYKTFGDYATVRVVGKVAGHTDYGPELNDCSLTKVSVGKNPKAQ